MAPIKIDDLPKDEKISEDEMKKVRGGFSLAPAGSISTPTTDILKLDYTAGKFLPTADKDLEGSIQIDSFVKI